MSYPLYRDIQLAEGYHFTDRLTSSYRLGYGHIKSCSPVMLSSVDGSAQEELLGSATLEERRSACFSPDGATLYYYMEHLYARDLASGAARKLEGIPQESPFDALYLLECSPDNRTLIFAQNAIPCLIRGAALITSPYRLCRVSTDGTGFRVLYEDPSGYRPRVIVCCWQQDFLLFTQRKQANNRYHEELWRVGLDDGHLELVGRFPDHGQDVTLHPDGKQAAWSSSEDGIALCSLESEDIQPLLSSGTCPAWSPDGKRLAFMQGQYRLCLLDIESGHTQDLIWFAPPCLSDTSYAGQPIWSPDGQMLWFTLTLARKLPPPRNLSEVLEEARRYIHPLLHNLNPRRTSYHVGYKPYYYLHRQGIVDLHTKQVLLSEGSWRRGSWNGLVYGVDWLPAL